LAVTCAAVEPAAAGAVDALLAAAATAPARAVEARASRAELVVSGRVTQVREVPRQPGQPITEHDPHWQEAVVQVHDVHRGPARRGSGPVTIRFAASHDIRWSKAPKFSVGQEGLWMLGDTSAAGAELRAAADVPRDQFLVVDPEDFHPKEHATAVLQHLP
ncbi:MAG: hypothetical protein JSR21_10940, partial [Proteobacteria bacterium]|nr:hypothetical protein [Pseudomonadota bacterium]